MSSRYLLKKRSPQVFTKQFWDPLYINKLDISTYNIILFSDSPQSHIFSSQDILKILFHSTNHHLPCRTSYTKSRMPWLIMISLWLAAGLLMTVIVALQTPSHLTTIRTRTPLEWITIIIWVLTSTALAPVALVLILLQMPRLRVRFPSFRVVHLYQYHILTKNVQTLSMDSTQPTQQRIPMLASLTFMTQLRCPEMSRRVLAPPTWMLVLIDQI